MVKRYHKTAFLLDDFLKKINYSEVLFVVQKVNASKKPWIHLSCSNGFMILIFHFLVNSHIFLPLFVSQVHIRLISKPMFVSSWFLKKHRLKKGQSYCVMFYKKSKVLISVWYLCLHICWINKTVSKIFNNFVCMQVNWVRSSYISFSSYRLHKSRLTFLSLLRPDCNIG